MQEMEKNILTGVLSGVVELGRDAEWVYWMNGMTVSLSLRRAGEETRRMRYGWMGVMAVRGLVFTRRGLSKEASQEEMR